jgi:hypothetical protein
MAKGKGTMNKWIWAVALTFVVYALAILASGMGINPTGIEWKFNNSGQFGDSFGPLSSIFACIAAISAFLAYSEQRNELTRVKLAYDEEKGRAEKRDFENTFFHLLEMKKSALNAVTVGSVDAGATGANAVDAIMNGVRDSQDDPEMLSDTYKTSYYIYRNVLSSYLRTCYHVVKYIDQSNLAEKDVYARIFRASLSNSEIVLIGVNAAVGGGREKFKPLIEKYALLHNISASDASFYGLIDAFKINAFGNRDISKEIASGSDGLLNKD